MPLKITEEKQIGAPYIHVPGALVLIYLLVGDVEASLWFCLFEKHLAYMRCVSIYVIGYKVCNYTDIQNIM